jgi:hypothetical protein
MDQKFTSYILTDRFVFTIAALHGIAAPAKIFVSKSSGELVPFLLFISFLVIGVFGSCFVVYGQGQRFASKIFQNGARHTIAILFVVVIGAISNAIQNTTFDALNSKMLSLLVGGAIGGIVTFIGILASQKVEKLSPLCLTVTGSACVAMSVFGCFIVLLALLVEQGLL